MTSLLITDSAAPPPSGTLDVDFVVDAGTYLQFDEISERMRGLGFQPSMKPDTPICRFENDGLLVDLMPVKESVLGFGNKWYQSVLDDRVAVDLPSGRHLFRTSGPSFLATKLVAFGNRGGGDVFSSKDIEDIVAVVDGRVELIEELKAAQARLKQFVRDEFTALLALREFEDCLHGMAPGMGSPQSRIEIIRSRFQQLAME